MSTYGTVTGGVGGTDTIVKAVTAGMMAMRANSTAYLFIIDYGGFPENILIKSCRSEI